MLLTVVLQHLALIAALPSHTAVAVDIDNLPWSEIHGRLVGCTLKENAVRRGVRRG